MDKQIKIVKPGKYSYRLDQPGEAIEVVARFGLRDGDSLNLEVEVVHVAENTKAKISLKAAVDDGSRARIMGKVVVEDTAKNTESFLEERILLLSPLAKAEVIPELEIKHNQVKCSHAATVGMIDAEQIFYLNARGIATQAAKKMIAEGFLK